MTVRASKIHYDKDYLALPAFDRAVDRIPDTDMCGAVVDVMDTAEIVKTWFDDHKVPFTAADLIATATLILKRERASKIERKREV